MQKRLDELNYAEILDLLDNAFPERSPLVTESYEQMLWRGGQRSVVSYLQALLRSSEEGDQ